MSCIVGTFHAMYHTTPGSYEHKMGIVEGGKMAMLAPWAQWASAQ